MLLVEAACEQHLHDVDRAVGRGDLEDRAALVVDRVDLGAPDEQVVHDVRVAHHDGGQQRRASLSVRALLRAQSNRIESMNTVQQYTLLIINAIRLGSG